MAVRERPRTSSPTLPPTACRPPHSCPAADGRELHSRCRGDHQSACQSLNRGRGKGLRRPVAPPPLERMGGHGRWPIRHAVSPPTSASSTPGFRFASISRHALASGFREETGACAQRKTLNSRCDKALATQSLESDGTCVSIHAALDDEIGVNGAGTLAKLLASVEQGLGRSTVGESNSLSCQQFRQNRPAAGLRGELIHLFQAHVCACPPVARQATGTRRRKLG